MNDRYLCDCCHTTTNEPPVIWRGWNLCARCISRALATYVGSRLTIKAVT